MRRVSKVLSPNDLGHTGSHQAGILIPKDAQILSFFPRLDVDKPNPDCDVVMFVPKLDIHWPARYIFYNSRDQGTGTRSEYRLTRLTGLLRDLRADVGDSLVFTRHNDGKIHVGLDQFVQQVPEPGAQRTLRNGWTMTIESGDEL